MFLFINDIDPNCFFVLKRNLNKLNVIKKYWFLHLENHFFPFFVEWKSKYYKLLKGM